MMMRFGTAVTAVAMAVVLTGCGEDDEDCEAAGVTTMVPVVMVDGKSGGSSGSRSGGSKSSGSKAKPGKVQGSSSGGSSGGKSKPKVKVDDDWLDDCDD